MLLELFFHGFSVDFTDFFRCVELGKWVFVEMALSCVHVGVCVCGNNML